MWNINREGGMGNGMILRAEREIREKTVDALLAAGYGLNLHNGGDAEELTYYTFDRAEILAAMNLTDEEWLLAKKLNGPSGWVRFVYGNDGWDVINDYSVNLEDVLAPVNEYADSLS
jgi:hypothetical protein